MFKPVPKRARDPLATGAIFRASPAALRSPMPRLLSPQSRVVSCAAEGAAHGQTSEGEPHHGGVGTAGRFGHLSNRFDDLYTRSPTPKVLLSRLGKSQAEPLPATASSSRVAIASSLGLRGSVGARTGGDATFATPSPRAPAAKKPPATVADSALDRQARKSGRKARSDDATPASTVHGDRNNSAHIASPRDASSDMEVDNLDDTPAEERGRKGRRGASADTVGSNSAASLRRAPLKEAPRASFSGAAARTRPTSTCAEASSTGTGSTAKKRAEGTLAQDKSVPTGGRTKRKAAVLSPVQDEASSAGAEARGGVQRGEREHEEGASRRPPSRREKAKVLSNWSIRLKRSSRGEMGIIVEGFLSDPPAGVAVGQGKGSLQWKTSLIQQRDSATRIRTSSGSVYVLQGPMDAAANKEVPPEIAAKFKTGFPANFKELVCEAEAITALQMADLEEAAGRSGDAGTAGARSMASGKKSAGKAWEAAVTSSQQEREQEQEQEERRAGRGAGRGQHKRGSAGGRATLDLSAVKGLEAARGRTKRGRKVGVSAGREPGDEEAEGEAVGGGGEGEGKAAQDWKNLNQMAVTDVSSLSTSRSGRKLQRPCDFWRQQVAVYEGSGSDRRLVGVTDGEKDLTSNFSSDYMRSPKTPQSGIKAARTPGTDDRMDDGSRSGKRRRRVEVESGVAADDREDASGTRGQGARNKPKTASSKTIRMVTKVGGGGARVGGVPRVGAGRGAAIKQGVRDKAKSVLKVSVARVKGRGKEALNGARVGRGGKVGRGGGGQKRVRIVEEESESVGGEAEALMALQQAQVSTALPFALSLVFPGVAFDVNYSTCTCIRASRRERLHDVSRLGVRTHQEEDEEVAMAEELLAAESERRARASDAAGAGSGQQRRLARARHECMHACANAHASAHRPLGRCAHEVCGRGSRRCFSHKVDCRGQV